MATNKIYFNNTTTPVTLKGVYYNGREIVGCKGIKLNGDIVVSFETSPGPVYQYLTNNIGWESYIDEYNSIWTSGAIDENINAVIKKTAQNECAIARTKWVTLIKSDLNTQQLFNFNGDARIFMSEDISTAWSVLQYKTTTIVTDLKDLYLGTYPEYSDGWLTGLPIVYKTPEGYFGTSVIDEDMSNISFNGNYEIKFIREAGGLTMSQMLDTIKTKLDSYGVAADVLPNEETIRLGDNGDCNPSEMGLQEILNILSNIYIPNAGPFVYSPGTNTDGDGRIYDLIPRRDFENQTYWRAILPEYVHLKLYTFIEAADDEETSPDIYIATGLDGVKIANLNSYSESTDSQNNPYNIIWYFTASCSDPTYSLAECHFPNALSEFSYVYNDGIDPSDVMSNWVGLDTSITRGSKSANLVFPNDQTYSQLGTDIQAGYPYPEYNSFFPGGQTFIQANGFENVEFKFVYDNTEGYADGKAVFDFYEPNFPSNLPSNPSKTKQFKIGLRSREYPCVVNTNNVNAVDSDEKWYADGYYDVCNIHQAYPIGVWTVAVPFSYATSIPVEYFMQP